MRKLFISLALASTALASPALARDGAVYVELDAGIMFLEDMDFDIGAVNDAATVDARGRDLGIEVDGADFGGIVGYDFGMFRLEGEVGYKKVNGFDAISSAVRLPAVTPVAASGLTGGAAAGTYDLGGDASVLSGMVNALLDFGPDDGLQGFVGGGAGIAKVDTDLSINSAGPGFVDDDDSGFAWQVIAGVRAPLTESMDVGLKYRFFNVDNVEMVDTSGRDLETRWRSHSVMGTFTYNFGGRAAPVEEYVAPPPPPPPAPVYEPAPPPPPPPARTGERG